MKKIALFSLVCCMGFVGNSFADRCIDSSKNVHLARVSPQQVWDNEFLFTNGKEYSSLKDLGYANTFTMGDNDIIKAMLTEGYTLKVGHVLECDDDSCKDGAFVFLPNKGWGRGDVTEGKEGTIFKCELTGDDEWVEQIVLACPKNAKIGRAKNFYEATDYHVIDIASSTNYFVVSNDDSLCKCDGDREFDTTTNTCVCKKSGTEWNGTECVSTVQPKQCPYEGGKYDIGSVVVEEQNCSSVSGASNDLKTGNKCKSYCLEKTDGNVATVWGIKNCPTNKPRGVKITNSDISQYKNGDVLKSLYKKCLPQQQQGEQTCAQKYGNDIKSVKCCEQEKQGLTVLDTETKECSCVDGKEPHYDEQAQTWQCVEPQSVEKMNCEYTFDAKYTCSNGVVIKAETKIPVKYYDCNKIQTLRKEDEAEFEKLIAKYCEPGQSNVSTVNTPSGPNDETINSAKNHLKGLEGKADVWTTAEGKFNTARLASDLTAGVVLGTVGGVVSGVVITKTQKEKGFEALHCTVGGQKMADWGDVFQVNFRR